MLLRCFEILDRGFEETGRLTAGDGAVIEGQRQWQNAMGGELSVRDDRPLRDAAGAEDRDLRRDNDQCRETPGEHSDSTR